MLVIYLVTLIQSAKRSLTDANETLAQIREDLESVSKQSLNLMAAGEQLIREADEKLHALDPITRSVKQTGEALVQVTDSVKQVSAAVSRSASGIGQTVERNHSRIAEFAEYASLGLQLWQKWQSHRNEKPKN
ncbi:MAG: hypothetical protein K0R57_1840 [Paenibacillaceae bacterium]|nr:hypothetical protein [Paenibacillaceae bacterium]